VGVLVVIVSGCGTSQNGNPSTNSSAPATTPVADAGHNVDGWWCSEHGIPEEECSLCSSDAAKKFKDKGDWCQDHDRAKSQCFVATQV
jgi:hypothetical protein